MRGYHPKGRGERKGEEETTKCSLFSLVVNGVAKYKHARVLK
jgi:hypothetical protein